MIVMEIWNFYANPSTRLDVDELKQCQWVL